MVEPQKRDRQKFAMVPEELILNARDADCLRIFAYLDLRQGDRGWPVRGQGRVARDLGLQRQTVAKHLRHLEETGWVKVDRQPGSKKKQVATVVHNPARGRWADGVSSLPERTLRHRARSRMGAPDTPPARPDPDDRSGGGPGNQESDRAVGASERSSHEPSNVRETNIKEPTCSPSDEPRSLSTRSGGCVGDEDRPPPTCDECHAAPIQRLVFLKHGGERQVCAEHAQELVAQGIVDREVAVDAGEPSSFPGDPFSSVQVDERGQGDEALSLVLAAFPGAVVDAGSWPRE